MARQPEIRGLITASWLHSPDTLAVSPHLAWLNTVFLENGGHVLPLGPADLDSGVLHRSPERQQAYEAGRSSRPKRSSSGRARRCWPGPTHGELGDDHAGAAAALVRGPFMEPARRRGPSRRGYRRAARAVAGRAARRRGGSATRSRAVRARDRGRAAGAADGPTGDRAALARGSTSSLVDRGQLPPGGLPRPPARRRGGRALERVLRPLSLAGSVPDGAAGARAVEVGHGTPPRCTCARRWRPGRPTRSTRARSG